MTTSTKRPRSTSVSSDSSLSLSSRSLSPAAKYSRLHEIDSGLVSAYSSLVCTLPPTCSLPNHSTRLGSPQEVEEHYKKYHTHVCEYSRCRCVFPDTRFLELHIAECHDPITLLRKDRGENTFACFLGPTTCTRVFSTPKGRRLHMISVHNYPKQYFFSIVNKGIGGLLKKWGPAASLYRGEWKPRQEPLHAELEDDNTEMDIAEDLDQQGPSKEQALSSLQVEMQAELPSITPGTEDHRSSKPDLRLDHASKASQVETNTSLNDISLQMSSLSLVPDKIRFGRGGKRGGFVRKR